jgi:hypothetical protein
LIIQNMLGQTGYHNGATGRARHSAGIFAGIVKRVCGGNTALVGDTRVISGGTVAVILLIAELDNGIGYPLPGRRGGIERNRYESTAVI